ncbi:hypothetical protein ACTFIU_008024 [Dictyostelium citrinum]
MIKRKFRLGCYSYEEIIYSEWMIRFGHLGLLREKVLKGDQMLIFNNFRPDGFFDYGDNFSNNNYNNNDKIKEQIPKELEFHYAEIYHKDLYDQYDHDNICYPTLSIFNVFKDDMEFFSKLLENYSYYFEVSPSSVEELFSTIVPIKKSVLEIPLSHNRTPIRPISLFKIIHFSIVYDNFALYKVLINNRYYIPTFQEEINDFIKAFQSNSFVVAEFIYRENLIPKTTSTTSTKKKQLEAFLTKESIDRYWSTIILDSYLHDKKRYLKINFIQNVLNSYSPPSSIVNHQQFIKFLRHLFNFEIFNKKLKSVIDKCIHLYHILNSLDSSIIQEINDNQGLNHFLKESTPTFKIQTFKGLELNDFKPLSIEKLNKIKLKFENTKEYLMKVGHLENNHSGGGDDDDEIKDLFKMLLFFSGNHIEINYLFYMAKYYKTFFSPNNNYYPIFSAWFGTYSLESNKDYKNLFKYCSKNDHMEVKKKFIKSAINDMMNPTISEIYKISPTLLFSIVLYQNDLELLKYVFELFPNIPLFSIDSGLIEKINSPDIFEYLYNKNLIRVSQQIHLLIEKYEIISHLKKNHPNVYKNSLNFYLKGNVLINQVGFIFDNWPDFKSTFQNDFTIFSLLSFQDFKTFVNKLPLLQSSTNISFNDRYYDEDEDNDRTTFNPPTSSPLYCVETLEKYNYILEKMPQDLLTGRCCLNNGPGEINHLNLQLHVHYLRNNLNEELLSTLPLNSNINLCPLSLFKDMVFRNDLKTLKLVLSKIKKSLNYYWLKDEIIKIATQFSNHFVYSSLNKYE